MFIFENKKTGKMISVQRKCDKCGKWNGAADYCLTCGNPISPVVLEEIKQKQQQRRAKEENPDKFDAAMLRMKNSPNFIVKGIYYLLYSIWTIFFIVLTFCLWLVAATPG